MSQDYGSPDKLTHIAKQYLERKATAEEVARALIEYLDRLGRPFQNKELADLHNFIQTHLVGIRRDGALWYDPAGAGWDMPGIGQMVRNIGSDLAAKLFDAGYRRAK